MTGKRILLVEDDKRIQAFNRDLFEGQGFFVRTAVTLADAKASISQQMPDVIVLDLNLPDGNGLDFLRDLRRTSKVPVLLLTGLGRDEDVIVGFESGCNDYLAKPYAFEVLLVRVKNLLHGAEQVPDAVSVGSLRLDMLANRAYIDGEDLSLTDKEFAIIRLLVQSEGDVISADDVYERIWGQPMAGDRNALQVAITRLRKKIEPAGYNIISMRGKGYVFSKG